MAQAFIYDLGTIDAALTDGTQTNAPNYPFTAGDDLTNEGRLNDQAIDKIVDCKTAGDAARFDFTTAISPNIFAVYVDAFTGACTIQICGHATDGAAAATKIDDTAALAVGWNFLTLTGSYRYWFARFSGNAELDISEMFFGTRYEFGFNPDKDEIDDTEYGIRDMMTRGGNEFSTKRHEGKDLWIWNWTMIDETMKVALKTMKGAIEGTRLKFLYDDESTEHWVKMLPGQLKFKKRHFECWDTTTAFRKQLI